MHAPEMNGLEQFLIKLSLLPNARRLGQTVMENGENAINCFTDCQRIKRILALAWSGQFILPYRTGLFYSWMER